jgi:hypothetical protein
VHGISIPETGGEKLWEALSLLGYVKSMISGELPVSNGNLTHSTVHNFVQAMLYVFQCIMEI